MFCHLSNFMLFMFCRQIMPCFRLPVSWKRSFCVLQGCDEFVVNSEPVLNEYECPLLAITKRIFSADCSQI